MYRIIDSHIHCGIQNVYWAYKNVKPLMDKANIESACMFAPVEDIYDRNNYYFKDDLSWQQCRKRANDYLLNLSTTELVFPYFFVWNDFRYEDLSQDFKGIKWHRHSDEPEYNYESDRCERFLQEIYSRSLHIVYEETYAHTLYFVKRIAGRIIIIIPHLGMINGGFSRLVKAGIWEEKNVYADTALASPNAIYEFIQRYGSEKLLYGSDWPFGSPPSEVRKIMELDIPEQDKKNIFSNNILRLLGKEKNSRCL
jgi:hypothetical protein